MTAIGTTTAIAMVPPFDSPLLELEGSEVAEENDEVEPVDEADVGMAFDDVEVGSNVLVEV